MKPLFFQKRLFRRTLLTAVFALLAALLFSGCSHYTLGNTAALPYRSIYVAPVENASVAPQAQALISTQTRTALINAGLSLESRANADAILTLTIVDYSRSIGATDEDDTMDVRAYDITIAVKATLTSAQGGTVYFKDLDVSSTLQILGKYGFIKAEYELMPLLAREIGRKVADAVTTVW